MILRLPLLFDLPLALGLAFERIHDDTNSPGVSGLIPGQHLKGAYTGQGRFILANNGSGGVLAEWKGLTDGNPGLPSSWSIVEINKFTEVTSKGGIYGADSQNDPVWSLGWDKRSVLLRVCDNGGTWKQYRLPKASYTHDADNGWYTEWPRIRDIGLTNGKYLMNMHGMMYQFPSTFSHSKTGGIYPFSIFLKMVVDYSEWHNQIVMACNDATTFSNGSSPRNQSNLLFIPRENLNDYGGKPYAFGGVWMNDSVIAGVPGEAFLINGFENRIIHLAQNSGTSVCFTLETDINGDNQWSELTKVSVPAYGYKYFLFPRNFKAQWLRIISDSDIREASAFLYLSNSSGLTSPELTSSIPEPQRKTGINFGVLRPGSESDLKLQYAASMVDDSGELTKAYYEIDGKMNFTKVNNPSAENALRTNYAPTGDFTVDNASVIMTRGGKNYRLPFGDKEFSQPILSGYPRGVREIVTERSMMNIHGTFYEIPRDDAGGFIKIRPITTHNKLIYDFCSWRGMLVLSGNFTEAPNDEHYKKSADGKIGLWFGNVDDLFKMGPPKGIGSTWKVSSVGANSPSLPLLILGYQNKKVLLSHDLNQVVNFSIEVDYMADGIFVKVFSIPVNPGETLTFQFPDGFHAHWVRTVVDRACTATATFTFEAGVVDHSEVHYEDNSPLSVYPNPAGEILNVVGLNKMTAVDVFSVAGTKVMSGRIKDQLDIQSLTPGIYILSAPNSKPVRFIKK